jgi:hypothetical protein
LRLTAHLNLPAPGRRQCLYVCLDHALAGTCVFAKQSLDAILCDRIGLERHCSHLLPAPLIPKLRGNFAEFLDRESLEHLRLLASPTCVGLRYGHVVSSPTKLFSAVCVTRPLRVPKDPLASALGYLSGFSGPGPPTTLHRHNHPPTASLLLRPSLGSNGYNVVREC